MMLEEQRIAFGYDDFGNSSELVAESDKEKLLDCNRASGDFICEICGVEYRKHPPVQGALWATRACNGIVKL